MFLVCRYVSYALHLGFLYVFVCKVYIIRSGWRYNENILIVLYRKAYLNRECIMLLLYYKEHINIICMHTSYVSVRCIYIILWRRYVYAFRFDQKVHIIQFNKFKPNHDQRNSHHHHERPSTSNGNDGRVSLQQLQCFHTFLLTKWQ